jgi:prepilin-type N-terminal cleavage/methylation domain-containing protein
MQRLKLRKKKIKGFTLLELMLVLIITAIMAGIGFYIYQKDQALSTCQTDAAILAVNLKYIRSQAMTYETNTGVNVNSSSYTLWITKNGGHKPINKISLNGFVPVSITAAPCGVPPCTFTWLPYSTSLSPSYTWGNGIPSSSGSFILKSGPVEQTVKVNPNGQISLQ